MQKNNPAIGFVGFGEAGFHIAKGLREAGIKRLTAYDINSGTPKLGERIQQRAKDTGTKLLKSSEALAETSDIILSVVTANAAQDAAVQTAPFLEARHLYADCNSISPAVKQAIDRIISGQDVRFVEAAIMAPVPPYGHRVPILLGGAGAITFADLLTPFGMRLDVIGSQVGAAAATKMFRSVIVKGMEALLFECVLGASRYGAEERVFASLAESFPGMNWKDMADYMIGRVVVHGERRAREMEEVAATLESIGIEPMMAAATAKRMDWSAKMGLRGRFGGEAPDSYRDVVEAIAQIATAQTTTAQTITV